MKRLFWNPWHGCHKCSPGCLNCFVFYFDELHDKNANIVTRSKTNFNLPLQKNRAGVFKITPGSEVATCFTSDFFIEEADPWRMDAWEIIRRRSDVRFLICTKRIERFNACLPPDWKNGYEHVTIAVTCENQQKANERLPLLLAAKAKRKYIFAAPLLESLDLSSFLNSGEIDLVSVGGESYTGARVCDFDWVRRIKQTCDRYHVAFDYHQTGSNFIMNGKQYKIKHRDEYAQAKKGMAYLRKETE